jgi:uncharacterized membrane protein YuzA (DUF378 family)
MTLNFLLMGFSQRIIGTVLGAAAMISSLGMALGPPLVGLGAVAIAFAFPAPRTRAAHLQPAT